MCSGMADKGAWRIDRVPEHWEGGMHMDEKIVFTRCVDGLESVSLRLKKLNNMIMAILCTVSCTDDNTAFREMIFTNPFFHELSCKRLFALPGNRHSAHLKRAHKVLYAQSFLEGEIQMSPL